MLFLHLNFDGIKTVVGDFSITGTHTLCIVMYLSKRRKQKERNSHNFIALFYPKIVLKEHHHISAGNTVNWFPSERLKKSGKCKSKRMHQWRSTASDHGSNTNTGPPYNCYSHNTMDFFLRKTRTRCKAVLIYFLHHAESRRWPCLYRNSLPITGKG